MNYPEGSAGAFIGVLVTVLGSVILGGAAFLLLQQSEGDPGSEGTATAVVATDTLGGVGAETATPIVSTTTPTATATPTASPTPTPTSPPAPEVEYVVVPGDALNLIATRHGVSAAAIIERNGLVPPYTIDVGQVLFIPSE